MGIGERLKEERKRLRLGQEELGEKVGVSRNTQANYEKEVSSPDAAYLSSVAAIGIDVLYVLTGQHSGEPSLASDAGPEFVEVPLYDIQAAAGNGRLFDEERIKYVLHFRRDWITQEGLFPKDLVAVEVVGDSMDGTLLEGDTVVVNQAVREGDGVFLLRLGEALRIKRVQRLTDGSLRLSSDNEFYAPEVVHPEQLTNVEIIGHCHWRGGRVY